MRWKNYLYLLPFLALAGCDKFEYDPNQSVNKQSPDRLNFEAIDKISQWEVQEQLTFVVTGDTHLDYDNTEKMVTHINNDPEVDFVIHLGDVTDHGLLKEYEWATGVLQKLRVPYLLTIGNHDVVSRGDEVYRYMYGPTDFSVIIDSVKFIFYNNNSREYDFNGKVPDLGWLENELSGDNFNRVVLSSHVPYWDRDTDQSKKAQYLKLINHSAKPVLAGFSGHLHEPAVRIHSETQVTHIIPGSVNRKTYLKVRIDKNAMTYERIYF